MKTRNFVTKRNPVIAITLCLVVGRSTLFVGPCNTWCCQPCLLRWLRGIKHRPPVTIV